MSLITDLRDEAEYRVHNSVLHPLLIRAAYALKRMQPRPEETGADAGSQD